MQNKNLNFKNGKFRIMQIADTQEIPAVSPDTIKLISAALDKEKPDLVVFTGDQIKGYSSFFMGEKGKNNVISTLKALIKPLEERNIPFTMTFGNHDGEAALGNNEQFEIYKESSLFVYADSVSENDKGTFCLNISDKFLVYLFDTHSKAEGGGYSGLNQEQLDWYRSIRDSYASPLPSLVFQHIPTPEFFDVIKRVKRFTKGCVRAYGDHKNEFYALDPHNSRLGDFMGESPAAPYYNSGEIDAFLEKSEVLGVYVGHDHNNSFVANYKGIDLGYTQGSGFNVYGPGHKRGVRIFDIDENGTYETRTVTYGELCGKDVKNKPKFFVYSYAPTNVSQVTTAVKEAAIVAGAVLAAVKLIKIIKKK
ncbi:MAG: metallophosphoesterase family protein [Clostridia bacterium]|nr:metallophosphoesterase family protein [Clostridia bacterium]MBQ4603441.1 metallophosphoesterase family protein [Clostridia bacterium]